MIKPGSGEELSPEEVAATAAMIAIVLAPVIEPLWAIAGWLERIEAQTRGL